MQGGNQRLNFRPCLCNNSVRPCQVTPSVDTLFDPASDDVVIPSLPQKYQQIILSDDWYIPGKAQRKKRKHRKSHGKISFTDLSKMVAAAWHSCPTDVQLFCAEVSDMTTQEYKKALYRQQKKDGINSKEKHDSSTGSKATKPSRMTNKRNDKKQQPKKKAQQKRESQSDTRRPSKVDFSTLDSIDEITVSTSAMFDAVTSTEPVITQVSNQSTSRPTSTVSSDAGSPSWPSVGQLSLPLSSYQNQYIPACLNIDDDAIWQMWMSCDS